MYRGFIKLHRAIDEWEWRAKPNTLSVWLYLLTHARHEPGSWQGVPLEAGQLITGTEAIGKVTGLSRQSVRTALEHLKKTGEITIKATNKFSIITVVKWGLYQSSESDTNQQTNQRTTNNQPATNQQLTTNKNEKNEKNVVALEVVVGDCDEGNNEWKKTLEYYGFPSSKSDQDAAQNLADYYSKAWLLEALRRTTTSAQGARNWKYVNAILDNWKKLGRIDAEGKRKAWNENIILTQNLPPWLDKE